MFLLIMLPIAVFCQDIGTIAFFDTECPKGWISYEPALGRTLIAAGGQYAIGSVGGQKQHQMTIEELVTHKHKNKLFGYKQFYSRSHLTNKAEETYPITMINQLSKDTMYLRSSISDYQNSNQIIQTGGSKPFNIMQPYLALNCCIKVHDYVAQQLQEMKIIQQQNFKFLLICLTILVAFSFMAFCLSLAACYFAKIKSKPIIKIVKGIKKQISQKSSNQLEEESQLQTA